MAKKLKGNPAQALNKATATGGFGIPSGQIPLGLPVNVGRYQFIADAFDGLNGFADGKYLVRYPRESNDKYDKRRELAYYENHLKDACGRFVGYLTKKPPQRQIKHPQVQAFIDDCDWKGTPLDVFLANFALEAKAKGSLMLLVDYPKFQPTDFENPLDDGRNIPYLTMLRPENIRTYQISPQGRLISIEIIAPYFVGGRYQQVIRGWNLDSWWVWMNGELIENGEHQIGCCPVIGFSEGMDFPCFGEFTQIADLSKRIYNLRSELDEILRGQTFSLLTYQLPVDQIGTIDPNSLAETIGVNNMLLYYGTQAPSFAQPSSGPAETYQKQIEALEQSIKSIGHILDFGSKTGGSGSADSGVALTIKFQQLNGALSHFGRRLEDLERKMFDLVCRWLDIENNVEISYPKSYEVSDMQTELNTLTQYKANQFPESLIRAKQKQIIAIDFSNLPTDQVQELLDDVDETNYEQPLLESRVAALERSSNQSPMSEQETEGIDPTELSAEAEKEVISRALTPKVIKSS